MLLPQQTAGLPDNVATFSKRHLSLDRQHFSREANPLHWLVDLSKAHTTFDVLAAALEEIHSEYHIREKETRTTTDNGSNFLKGFRLSAEEKEEEATNEQEERDSPLDDEDESDPEVSAVLDENTP